MCVWCLKIQKGSGIHHTTQSSQLGPIIWKHIHCVHLLALSSTVLIGCVHDGQGELRGHFVQVVHELGGRECAHDLIGRAGARSARGGAPRAAARSWR